VVRATNDAGYAAERAAFEIAYENFRRRDTLRAMRASATPPAGSVIPTTALAAGVPLTAPARPALRLRVWGALPAALAESGLHRLGDTLELRAGGDLTARYRLPDGADSAGATWLSAEPLIQSDNPRIRAQARLLVGRERDPARVAATLLAWVREEIRAAPAVGLPSAVRVFETRRGDCNEHAVLYVALARAAGIPARTVSGVLALGGGFYYHAWSEVYLGDWIAVDPLLGQLPADASHLRLVVGGLARQVELLPLTGAMRLEVL
jgi:transglutaminase-like putative cysteine protease